MLQLIASDPTTFTVVSDDEQGENGALQDAIGTYAPHLLDAFEATEIDADGLLRFGFDKEDWASLQEVLESDELTMHVPPEDLEEMVRVVGLADAGVEG